MNKRNTRHGMRNTKIWRAWRDMRTRCLNKNSKDYSNYGGRGISICIRWNLFENFFIDMGNPPSQKHELDRIDNDKGYYPTNCRWSTRSEQLRNRRSWKGEGEAKVKI